MDLVNTLIFPTKSYVFDTFYVDAQKVYMR